VDPLNHRIPFGVLEGVGRMETDLKIGRTWGFQYSDINTLQCLPTAMNDMLQWIQKLMS